MALKRWGIDRNEDARRLLEDDQHRAECDNLLGSTAVGPAGLGPSAMWGRSAAGVAHVPFARRRWLLMAADRWWSKDRSRKVSIRVLLALLAALIIGVFVAVTMTSSEHDAKMVHQPMVALDRVSVPGSVRRTSIESTGCGGYVSPVAERTDWSTLPPADVERQVAVRVTAAGWTKKQVPADGFTLDGMTLTVVAERTVDGGSKVETSIASPEPCNSDQ